LNSESVKKKVGYQEAKGDGLNNCVVHVGDIHICQEQIERNLHNGTEICF